jgi:hypothetical protein
VAVLRGERPSNLHFIPALSATELSCIICLAMPTKTEKIQDEGLRNSLTEAQANLKSGDYRKVVDLAAGAYLELLRRKPALLRMPLQLQTVMFFPRLGAHLQLNSTTSEPELIYDREKFSFSEAVTYWEFVVDAIVRHKL